jgi:hypothetical protein
MRPCLLLKAVQGGAEVKVSTSTYRCGLVMLGATPNAEEACTRARRWSVYRGPYGVPSSSTRSRLIMAAWVLSKCLTFSDVVMFILSRRLFVGGILNEAFNLQIACKCVNLLNTKIAHFNF